MSSRVNRYSRGRVFMERILTINNFKEELVSYKKGRGLSENAARTGVFKDKG